MPIYTVQLKNRSTIANQTIQFSVTKPEHFTFLAGQYAGVNITIPNHPPQIRRFSFCSIPQENELIFATRVQLVSDYKKLLLSLPLDATLTIAGPSGEFVWQHNHNIKVFLAGGIGITPIYSLLKAHLPEVNHPVFLFYSNRHQADIAWYEELIDLEKQFTHFKVIFHLTGNTADTKKSSSENRYRFERIQTHTLSDYLNSNDIKNSEYYICGQENFVHDLKRQLAILQCANIMVESFK